VTALREPVSAETAASAALPRTMVVGTAMLVVIS